MCWFFNFWTVLAFSYTVKLVNWMIKGIFRSVWILGFTWWSDSWMNIWHFNSKYYRKWKSRFWWNFAGRCTYWYLQEYFGIWNNSNNKYRRKLFWICSANRICFYNPYFQFLGFLSVSCFLYVVSIISTIDLTFEVDSYMYHFSGWVPVSI